MSNMQSVMPHPAAPRPAPDRPPPPPAAPRPAPDRPPPPPAPPRPAHDRPPVRSPREPLAGVVHELRVLVLERQHDVPHRPVPVHGDDDVRLAGPLGILVVVLLAVDEHHEVRVLLDLAAFAKVREDRTLLAAPL